MENIAEKLENIRLLKELFVHKFYNLSQLLNEQSKNFNQSKKIQKNIEQTHISFDIVKQNIKEIKSILEQLIPEKKEGQINNQKIDDLTKVLINLQLLTNLFASEFIYLTKKIEKDLKSNKKIPQEYYIEAKKIKYDIDIIEKFIQEIEEKIPIKEKIPSDQKKKHKGFLITSTFIKKKFFLARIIKKINNKQIEQKISLHKINPEIILNNSNIPCYLKSKMTEEFKNIQNLRNEAFQYWQPLINEILFHFSQKFFSNINSDIEIVKNTEKELSQQLSKQLIIGLDLLIYPQKDTLIKRLRTYAQNYFDKLYKENKEKVRFNELNGNNEENNKSNKEEINFLPVNILRILNNYPSPEEALTQKEDFLADPNFLLLLKKEADRLNLKDESKFLENLINSIHENKKLHAFFDFGKDYQKKKIKGSLDFLIRITKSKIMFKYLKNFKNI